VPQQVHALAVGNVGGSGRRSPDVSERLPGDRFTIEGEHETGRAGRECHHMVGAGVDDDLGEWDGPIAGACLGWTEACPRPAVGDELPIDVEFTTVEVDPVHRQTEHFTLPHAGAGREHDQRLQLLGHRIS